MVTQKADLLTDQEVVELCEYLGGRRDKSPTLGMRWVDDKGQEVKPKERYYLMRTAEGEKQVGVD